MSLWLVEHFFLSLFCCVTSQKIRKKCSSGQRFICTELTSYKIPILNRDWTNQIICKCLCCIGIFFRLLLGLVAAHLPSKWSSQTCTNFLKVHFKHILFNLVQICLELSEMFFARIDFKFNPWCRSLLHSLTRLLWLGSVCII